MLPLATAQNASASASGTPNPAIRSFTASNGSACTWCRVRGNRSSASNLVGAAPKLPTSNPATSSSIDDTSSTGFDDPSRAIS